MQKCWHPDPNKRPTAFDIRNRISTIINNEKINPAEIIESPDIRPMITNHHSGAIYKSRLKLTSLNYVSKELEFDIDDEVVSNRYNNHGK